MLVNANERLIVSCWTLIVLVMLTNKQFLKMINKFFKGIVYWYIMHERYD